MQLSSENARRSRFWLVTYSIACQRVTRLTRLPTFALPATAPTCGSCSGSTSSATVFGANSVSASRQMTISPLAYAESVVQRARLAAVRLAKDAHLRMIAVRSARDLVRVVRRSVIDDHDLELARILLRDQRLDRAQDDLLLVVRRHDHAHRWREGDRRIAVLVIPDALDDREHRHEHEPREAEEDGEEEDPVEQPLHHAQRSPADQLTRAREPIARRQPRHRLIAREPDQLRQRHDRVADGAQGVDERAERRDGLAAIAAAIVQQHDVAARALREHGIDDRLHARRLPILGVDVQTDDQVAALLRDLRRHELVRASSARRLRSTAGGRMPCVVRAPPRAAARWRRARASCACRS